MRFVYAHLCVLSRKTSRDSGALQLFPIALRLSICSSGFSAILPRRCDVTLDHHARCLRSNSLKSDSTERDTELNEI